MDKWEQRQPTERRQIGSTPIFGTPSRRPRRYSSRSARACPACAAAGAAGRPHADRLRPERSTNSSTANGGNCSSIKREHSSECGEVKGIRLTAAKSRAPSPPLPQEEGQGEVRSTASPLSLWERVRVRVRSIASPLSLWERVRVEGAQLVSLRRAPCADATIAARLRVSATAQRDRTCRPAPKPCVQEGIPLTPVTATSGMVRHGRLSPVADGFADPLRHRSGLPRVRLTPDPARVTSIHA